MESSNRDGSAGYQPSAHGGRSSRGFMHRAKNIHSKLSTPIDPDLDGVGVHVDIPDLVDRFQNGNQFNVGASVDGLKPYVDKRNQKVGFSLLNGRVCPDRDIGAAFEIGKVEGGIDGLGVKYNACGAATNVALGPVDIGGKLGTAEAGAKIWEPDVGLDVGIKANASAVQANVGPINMNVGVGVDTGVKFGKEGVGVEVLGTGFQIGRTTGFSLFGSSLSFKLW
ncbi:unnamed protein product [Rotaria socialis]|uniref:Uncharacterized protein n=1 Tax=Rotaria socialis TaxID=392032 RepID=A0A818FY53_9BILA|nr:unnamed protein product [Rotaria socialis]CAF3315532.1 unnamed protein product [Rotaria socialis]CAF3483100.1 unnamed protein product [Rotaria socialis]CAF3568196.1 unnamed protein product [Rotaria socialis]CAF3647679.1 unnamed protein product [Rotaria socialis]